MSVLNRLTLLEHMVDNLNARLQAVEADRKLGVHTDGDRQHLYPATPDNLYPRVSLDSELTCPPGTSLDSHVNEHICPRTKDNETDDTYTVSGVSVAREGLVLPQRR